MRFPSAIREQSRLIQGYIKTSMDIRYALGIFQRLKYYKTTTLSIIMVHPKSCHPPKLANQICQKENHPNQR